MSLRMRDAMTELREQLRYEPSERRFRAVIGGRTVLDTTDGLLVWRPGRIVPSLAVPEGALATELVPADAFEPAGADLPGYVVLEERAFDEWYEEDEQVIGHPRDPYHRIDVRRSSRTVRIERDGRVLAESSRPTLLFETGLPMRFYIPREDMVADLVPSRRRSTCPYKGEANYFAIDGEDLVWCYEHPLPEVAPIAGLLAFYDERVDVALDGVRRPRPVTPFSRPT